MRIGAVVCCMLLITTYFSSLAQTDECSGLTPVPLIVGERGQVSPGQSNNVRDVPGRDGARVGQLAGGDQFEVRDGPICADGFVWWQIGTESVVGWTVDGADGEQWLVPLSVVDVPPVLSTNLITPDNAAQLQSIRTMNCDSGADSSAMIALGVRVVAVNCGYYNINAPDASLQQKLLDDQIGILDLESGQQIMTLNGDGATAYPIGFLPDGHLLWFSQEESRSIILLHLSDVTSVDEMASNEIDDGVDGFHLFSQPIFYANNTRFALLYEDEGDYVLHRWDAMTLTPLDEQVFNKPDSLTHEDVSFAISPDGGQFAIHYQIDASSELAIYTSNNPRPIALITTPFVVFNYPARLTFSPSGNFIVGVGCQASEIQCGDPALFWWRAADGTEVAEWDVPVEAIGGMTFSPDGALLAMGTTSGAVLYDVNSGDVVYTLPTDASQVKFSIDGTFIVTQGDPLTQLWTVRE